MSKKTADEQPVFQPTEDLSELNDRAKKRRRALIFIALWVLAAVIIVLCCRYIYRGCYSRNDRFLLQTLQIDTNGNKQIEGMVQGQLEFDGIKPGEIYLPEIAVGDIRKKLLENPRLADVMVRRSYPDGLDIRVTPRVPVAVIRYMTKNKRYAELRVDQDGWVVPGDLQGVTVELPLLMTNGTADEFHVGHVTDNAGVLAFLDLTRCIETREDGGVYQAKLATFDGKNERMTIFLRPNPPFREGASMVLPYKNINGTLDRIGIVLKKRIEQGQSVLTINGCYDNIPVTP